MAASLTEQLILRWSGQFSADELTVEDVQDRFAALDPPHDLPSATRKRILEAMQELDSIRYGMCERGQRDEITRIFHELEQLIRPG